MIIYGLIFCFNSLLVRLEASLRESLRVEREMFQFLIGAIGSTIAVTGASFSRVSIPYWCDWKEQLKSLPMQP